MVLIHLTLGKVPIDARTKERSGVPFGCVVQPFTKETEVVSRDGKSCFHAGKGIKVGDVGRCSECYAYVNRYCYFDYRSWVCSLCGTINELDHGSRYMNIQQRPKLGELASSFVDLEYGVGESDQAATGSEDAAMGAGSAPTVPTFVAVVDLSGTEEQLEIAKSALLAGLEGLSPNSLFGLVTVSDRIGLFDVKASRPSVRYVSLSQGEAGDAAQLALDDVVPLRWFLAEVGEHRDAIERAVDGIDALRVDGPSNASSFGPALEILLEYLTGKDVHSAIDDDESNPTGIAFCRVMSFLFGPPGFGDESAAERIGSGAQASNGASWDAPTLAQSEAATEFCTTLGLHASSCSIACDLYIITAARCNLKVLEPLVKHSGGRLFYYPNLEACNAPQDMHRLVTQPQALRGTLRLRTSNEYKISNVYGHLVEHSRYSNLYHTVACDSTTCYGVDFVFNSSGFSRDPELAPTLQMAFQYSVFEPTSEDDKGEKSAEGDKPNLVLKQRLRIYTIQISVAKSIRDLYDYVDVPSVLTLLIHKASEVVYEKGVEEARSLLEDWLIMLIGEYNYHYKDEDEDLTMLVPDINFEKSKAMQSLPVLIYALLRGPLFSADLIETNIDEWTYLLASYTTSPPRNIITSIYPMLSTYAGVDEVIKRGVFLNREDLEASEGVIHVLDSCSKIIVYYTKEGLQRNAFPPPQESLVRRHVNEAKASSNLSPHLIMIREGIDDCKPFFDAAFIEDAAKRGAGSSADYGYPPFLEAISTEVKTFLTEL